MWGHRTEGGFPGLRELGVTALGQQGLAQVTLAPCQGCQGWVGVTARLQNPGFACRGSALCEGRKTQLGTELWSLGPALGRAELCCAGNAVGISWTG